MFECLSTRTNDHHNLLQINDWFFFLLFNIISKSEMMTSQCLIAILLIRTKEEGNKGSLLLQ